MRAQFTTYSFGNHQSERQVTYGTSGNLSATGFVGADLFAGSSGMSYAATVEFGLTNQTALIGGLDANSLSTDFSLGDMLKLGKPRPERSEILVLVTLRIIHGEY